MTQWPAYSETRYQYLGYAKCAPNLWRIVCLDWLGGGTQKDAPAVIGPQYRTKSELLGDLDRYATESGYSQDRE